MTNTTRVFSEARITQSPTWVDTVKVLPYKDETQRRGKSRLWIALRNACIANRLAGQHDIFLFEDTQPLSISLTILLASLKLKRPTILRADPLLRYPRRRWTLWYHRGWMRSTDKLLVWSPAVIERYYCAYGFPKEKMQAVHFHHTLAGYSPEVADGEYVFSGGNSLRDYPTLLQAVKGTDIPIVISTQTHIEADVPTNVRIVACSHAEFRSLMAGARFIVIPLDMSQLATTGQQSYLNAMALGKLVIVTDTVDAPFYIENGSTGLLTPSGDAESLRKAIVWAWEHPAERQQIGHRAKIFAEPMDTEWWCRQLLDIALRTHMERRHLTGGIGTHNQ